MSEDARFAQAVEITIATYDRAAANYATRNQEQPPFWAERMRQFVGLLDAAADPSLADLPLPEPDAALEEYLGAAPVLDAGCGAGRDARALAAHGLPVLAVDLSQGMLDAARERTARRLSLGAIHYALLDLRRLDLPDACCRGVWCSASLLHLPKPVAPRAMAELARVARSGAPLMLFLKQAGPAADQTFHAYEYVALPDARRFFAYYTPDEAAELVRRAGFAAQEVWLTEEPRPPDAPGWIAVAATRG
jgi:SAM-dependent methyltransferase